MLCSRGTQFDELHGIAYLPISMTQAPDSIDH